MRTASTLIVSGIALLLISVAAAIVGYQLTEAGSLARSVTGIASILGVVLGTTIALFGVSIFDTRDAARVDMARRDADVR